MNEALRTLLFADAHRREKGRTAGATIAVARVRVVAEVPERLKEERLVSDNRPAINAELVGTVDAIVLRVAKEASSPYGATRDR
jgi:hypothetical protein